MNGENYANIHYYQGALGPTIVIDVSTGDLFQALKDIVKDLSVGNTTEFELHKAPFVKCDGLEELILKAVPEWTDKNVKRYQKQNGKVTFEWVNSVKDWGNCLRLLEGLTELESGHQYLSSEGIDDAIIEISCCEYSKKKCNMAKKNNC